MTKARLLMTLIAAMLMAVGTLLMVKTLGKSRQTRDLVRKSSGSSAGTLSSPREPSDSPNVEAEPCNVKLGTLPDLRLTPEEPVSEQQAKKIRELIAGLTSLDKPDFGLSATLSGDAFTPVPGQSHAGALLLTDHAIQSSEALKTLVALGPVSLPFLLEALDDATPTKITVKYARPDGGMWHAAELDLNPVNPAETGVVRARVGKSDEKFSFAEKIITSYTVKVGDVCFVAIGQIVGRSYQAVRYQPSACVVLNCPSHDSKLCADVRAIWKAPDARSKLFDSLLADYATEGVFNGKSLDGWHEGNDFQCRAALRLLYYFPKEAAPLLASRLDKLDVGKDDELDDFMRRCVANGVRADQFIKAVAWSKQPAVREALAGVFHRAEDVQALLAALPGVDDKKLIRERVEAFVAALPPDEHGPYGQGFDLLVALCQLTPETSRKIVDRYLKDASAQRCHTVCLVLRKVLVDWDADVLAALLTDKRTWGWTYAVKPNENEPRQPIRVCDEAALTLSLAHPDLKFKQAGKHSDLDKQIDAIQKALGRKR